MCTKWLACDVTMDCALWCGKGEPYREAFGRITRTSTRSSVPANRISVKFNDFSNGFHVNYIGSIKRQAKCNSASIIKRGKKYIQRKHGTFSLKNRIYMPTKLIVGKSVKWPIVISSVNKSLALQINISRIN